MPLEAPLPCLARQPSSPLHSARPCSAVVSAARVGYPAVPYAWRAALSAQLRFILIANCPPKGISAHIRAVESGTYTMADAAKVRRPASAFPS